jgi:hypothetical protein
MKIPKIRRCGEIGSPEGEKMPTLDEIIFILKD